MQEYKISNEKGNGLKGIFETFFCLFWPKNNFVSGNFVAAKSKKANASFFVLNAFKHKKENSSKNGTMALQPNDRTTVLQIFKASLDV